jgi:multidrug efflux pump subunit AcrA (membrane-fusion protein)
VSPLEQEQLLEQTRANIRQNIAEIAELARTGRNGVQFFRDFLARVVAALQAQGGAVWLPGADGKEFQVIAESNFATCAYHENERQRRDIHRVLGEVMRNKRPFIVGSVAPDVAPSQPGQSAEEEIMNTTAYPMFYVPVFVGEQQQIGAILNVWLRAAGDPKTYPTLVTFLNSVCVHAGSFLKARQGDAAMARNQEYENMLRFQGDFIGELDPGKIGRAAVNHFTDLFQANRCSIFRKVGNHWRLDFVSNQESIDQRSELVVRLCALAARLPVAMEPAALSLDNPEEAADWSDVLEPLHARQIAYTFFQPHHHEADTGMVLLERHAANVPFTPVHLRQMQWAGKQLGRAMVSATTYREAPFRRVLRPVTVARGLWRRGQRVRLAAWVGIPVLLLTLWLLVPWTLRVEGDCTVQPAKQVTVSAETPGKIESVPVQEGQVVEKGALLAKLEDEDLRTQIAMTIQDSNKWQAEVNRFQSVGDDAQRKLAEINRQGALAKLERLRFLQSRTELRAPISGVVLTKNLANRVGETLELGKPFCELAARDVYEVQIDLHQQDLGVMLEALRDRGALPVDFILHAHTGTRLHTVIRGANSISQMARIKPGGAFFQARADFPVDSTLVNSLKPGYTGKAKINLGRRPLAAVMLRKFFDYWRVEWSL